MTNKQPFQKPHISQRIDRLLLQLAVNIGPWFVPISAALVFGVMFKNAVTVELGEMALIAGISAALGLEIAGIISFHVAVSFYSARQGAKAAVALGLGLAYVIIGITGVWAIDTNESFRVVGTITFLLVPIVYFSRALAKDLERYQELTDEGRAEKKAILDDNRQKQWELQVKKLDLEQAAKLARIEANKQVKISQAQPVSKLPETDNSVGNLPETAGGLPETNNSLPEWLPVLPESLTHFRQLVSNGSATLPGGLTGAELGRVIGKSARTGQNWLAAVRNGKAQVIGGP